MPVITDEEYEIFRKLLKEKHEKEEEEDLTSEIKIDQLSKRVKGFLDLNKQYGTLEAYARTFARFLKGDFKKHKTDTLFFSWSEIRRYLTKVCLDKDPRNNYPIIKSEFRKRMKDLGFMCKIDNRWNTFTVVKCSPRKVVRK